MMVAVPAIANFPTFESYWVGRPHCASGKASDKRGAKRTHRERRGRAALQGRV